MYEDYVSVVKCREVLEYHETLYFGEYHFVLFELNVMTNKNCKTKNHVFHWCVFSSVNR